MWNKTISSQSGSCWQTPRGGEVCPVTTGYQPNCSSELSHLTAVAATIPATPNGRRTHHRRSPTAMQRRLEKKQERFSARQVVHEELHSQDKTEKLLTAILNIKSEMNTKFDQHVNIIDKYFEEFKANIVSDIKKFFGDKGFGFIAPDNGGEDVFVHGKVNGPDRDAYLEEGDAVEYELEWDNLTSKNLAEMQESLRTTQNSFNDCFKGVAEVREEQNPGGAVCFEAGSGGVLGQAEGALPVVVDPRDAEIKEQHEVAFDAGGAEVAALAVDSEDKPLFEFRYPGPGWVRIRDAYHPRKPLAGDRVLGCQPHCEDQVGTLVQLRSDRWDVRVAGRAESWH